MKLFPALFLVAALAAAAAASLPSGPLSDASVTSLDSSMGAALKGYRTTFGMTQAQLATASKVSSTAISRIERGLDSGKTAQWDSIAVALHRVYVAKYNPSTSLKIVSILTRNHLQ